MSSNRPPAASIAVYAAIDVVLVVVFVLIGRRNHDEGFALVGTVTTLWPFLAGLAVGWLGMRAWRSPTRVVWTGIGIWIATVAVGMALRAVSGQGTAFSFVVVATLVLGVFLIGWRALTLLAARRKSVTA
jgi:peptidoglycan/LPS O-acetylase OafA/YrhL